MRQWMDVFRPVGVHISVFLIPSADLISLQAQSETSKYLLDTATFSGGYGFPLNALPGPVSTNRSSWCRSHAFG
jgi:hypothetical protein